MLSLKLLVIFLKKRQSSSSLDLCLKESEIFIRELVQNSLDAKNLDDSNLKNEPVLISIKYFELKLICKFSEVNLEFF